MINFTVLVHNRPRLTRQMFQSLKWSGMSDLKVTAIAHQCNPETLEVFREFNIDFLPVNEPMGTGPLRNMAIERAEKTHGRADLLYLSDNDVYFHDNWTAYLSTIYDLAWDHGFRAIGAYNHPFHIPTATYPLGDGWSVNEINALALQSMMMRWEVWDKYGPFCDTPPNMVCQSEDVDFANRLHADGGKLGVVSPALLVNTGITNSLGERIPGWEMVKNQCPPGVHIE